MSTIKEFREFFLRHTQVVIGTKADQEGSFPTQYQVGGINRFNRFLKNDFPSESIFKKLFESIAFKLNPEDTASLTVQGLVRTSDDENVYANTSGDSFKTIVEPHQVPELNCQATLAFNFTGSLVLGDPIIYGVATSSIVNIQIGAILTTASGIPANTTVVAVDFINGEVTMSNNSTVNTVAPVTITHNDYDSDSTFLDQRNGLSVQVWKRRKPIGGGLMRKFYEIKAAVTQSIEVFEDTQALHLVGDSTAPGNDKYYGTNATGVKGWYSHTPYTTLKISLTAAQIKASSPVTPILIVSAPGAGKYLRPVKAEFKFVANTTPFASSSLKLSTQGHEVNPLFTTANIFLGGVDDFAPMEELFGTNQLEENKGLVLYADIASLVGDGTIDVYVTYKAVTL